MQFNSYVFILGFLPIQMVCYFLANKISEKLGKAVLILGSLVFYAYADVAVVTTILFSVVLNYLFSCGIRKFAWKRTFLCVPIVVNVALLLYFKYTNFAITNLNLLFAQDLPLRAIVQPLGISFFTFQQISYLVSVYRGLVGNNFLDYMAYILYFPKILMGPLVEPVDFYRQLNNPTLKRIDWNNVACGIQMFSFGLIKKMLLADTFAKAVAWGFDNIRTATAADWLFVSLFYTFQIYFDFSGYCDMAVGTSLMLNITLPINFNSPYKALSIRDFWKRWHISLTAFFTKYIYIPLGGSRRGQVLLVVNTMIVFLVSGIWHGANWTFILWGVLHGLFSLFDRMTEAKQKKVFEPVRWILTFAVINLLWLLFRAESVSQWLDILRTLFFCNDTRVSEQLLQLFNLPERALAVSVLPVLSKLGKIRGLGMSVFTLAAFALCLIPENNYQRKEKISRCSLVLAAVAFVVAFTCLGAESVFVYYNF